MERKKEGADVRLSPFRRKRNEASFFPLKNRIEAQRSGLDPERKKEGADVRLSPFRRKRNEASFF